MGWGGGGDALERGQVARPAEVHAFFYLWYGTPAVDGEFKHWNHEVLPHWREDVRKRFAHGHRHRAPEEIHAPFYPRRGVYSSRDPDTLNQQMVEVKSAGVEVLVLSWWGQASREGTSDTQGVKTDDTIAVVVEAIERADLRFAIHMEPYPGRSAATLKDDVAYLRRRFGGSKHWLKRSGRPVFYVYDSYHTEPHEWAEMFSTLRGTVNDGFFIALWLNGDGGEQARAGGFDGVYTYFASDGFVYGSSIRHWPRMKQFCTDHGLEFVASVGPGYNDSRIRPWNKRHIKPREDGSYYDRMWGAALRSGADTVAITSWNEWGEGTQIEPARQGSPGDTYLDYGGDPDFYISKTRDWVGRLKVGGSEL